MSTTTRTQRLEASLDAASRNLGPVLASRVDPATGHLRGLHRPPYTLPTRPPDEPGDDGRPLADLTLSDLTLDEYTLLIDQLLEDWDCPTMTELGLCRAHRLSLDQLDRITDDPAFDRALARIRSIRAKRRPERHAAARAQIFDRLLGLLAQPQDTAARAKEVRLACKHLQTILDTPEPDEGPDPDHDGGAEFPNGGAEFPNGGAEFHSAFGQRPNPNALAGSPPSPSTSSSPPRLSPPLPTSPSSPSSHVSLPDHIPAFSPPPPSVISVPSVPSVVNPHPYSPPITP